MLLVARAIELLVDGLFGRKTQGAVRAFQRLHDCRPDGVVGPETLMALWRTSPRNPRRHQQATRRPELTPCAPNVTEARPQNVVPLSEISRTGPVSGPADGRLAQLQLQAVQHAQGELGVRENPPGSNRGARVDQYARNAGMPVGGAWCAYFVNHAYSQTARDNGGDFAGRLKLHSYQKNYAWFAYGSITAPNQRKAAAEGRALRAEHERDGSTRRYMALEGSPGHRYAKAHGLPHEVYRRHDELPIRAGDTALFRRGHVGMVKSYDRETGQLVTLEGNAGGRVRERRYDLSDPSVLAKFDGFGRPALSDLTPSSTDRGEE